MATTLRGGGADVSIQGLDEVLAAFHEIMTFADDRVTEESLLLIGKYLRDEIRSNTPDSGLAHDNKLNKSIVAKKFRSKVKGSPSVFVAVDRRKAPHWHWVEFGTQGYRIATDKAKKTAPGARWVWLSNGRFYSAKNLGGGIYGIGPMPAQPFFRSTVDSNRNMIEVLIKDTVVTLVEEKWNRKGRHAFEI